MDAEEIRKNVIKYISDKKELVLSVEVESEDQVDELFRWMYGDTKPLKSELIEIGWNKAVVSKKEAEALELLKAAMQE